MESFQNESAGGAAVSVEPAIGRLGQLIDHVDHQGRFLSANMHVAAQNHQILGEISRALDQLGFTMDRVAASVQMQGEHFDALRRENMLKEILYKMARFQDSLNTADDQIPKAYGAKLLLQTVELHEFGTRDLSTFADKRFFDEQIERAREILASLDEEERSSLEHFERLYAMYLEMDEFDPSALFPKKKLLPLPEPELDQAPLPPRLEDMFGHFPPLVKKGYVLLAFVSMNLMILSGLNAWREPLENHPAIHIGFAVSFGLLLLWTAAFFLLSRRAARNLYPRVLTEYQRRQQDRAEHVRRLFEEITAANEEIRQFNRQQDDNIETAYRNHEITRGDMRRVIHSFLDKHPALQRFLPKF